MKRKAGKTREPTEIFAAFSPEPGYRVGQLLCLSYSLTPSVAAALLLRCLPGLGQGSGLTHAISVHRANIRNVIRDIFPRSTFVINGLTPFGQEEKIGFFEDELMTRVEQLPARKSRGNYVQGSFHPKMLLVFYTARYDEGLAPYAKCYVGSRNFSRDIAREFGAVIHLEPSKNVSLFTNDLCSFLTRGVLPELRQTRNRSNVQALADALALARMRPRELPRVKSVSLHWQSRHNSHDYLWEKLHPVLSSADSIGVVSPWLSAAACERLKKLERPESVSVLCLETETSALNCFRVERPPRLKTFASAEGSLYEHTGADANTVCMPALHQKYYIATRKKKQTIFFGSANFTSSGVGPSRFLNTELLVRYDLDGEWYAIKGDPVSDGDTVAQTENTAPAEQEWLECLEVAWEEVGKSVKLDPPDWQLNSAGRCKLLLQVYLRPQGVCDYTRQQQTIVDCRPTSAAFNHILQLRHEIHPMTISALMLLTLKTPKGEFQSMRCVPLPESLVDSRLKNLPVELQVTPETHLEELLTLINAVAGIGWRRGDEEHRKSIDRVVSGVALDRFVYKLALLRTQNRAAFLDGISEVEEKLDEMKKMRTKKSRSIHDKRESQFKRALSIVMRELKA